MKKIKYIIIGLVVFVSFSSYSSASSVSIGGKTSVTKGNSVTISATVSSDSPLVSVEGTFICKGAGVNEGVDMVFDDSSNSIKSKSYSITFKSNLSGTVTCSTSGVRITNMSSDSWQTLDNKALNIIVNEPAVVVPKVYSSNNNLKSLSIEGYTINPDFNKDTLEYSVEVPNDTKNITINADKEDSKASISGTGEKEVIEGLNKFEIKVEAENGNVKTYVINVTVKELDPIEVMVNNNKYTIIRKEGLLEAPLSYEKSSVKIGDEDVLCYKNNKTGSILIGLSNEKEAKFFIYDEKTGKYTSYKSINVNGISLKLLNIPKNVLPSGYSKVSFTYDNNRVEGYQYFEKGVTYAASDKVKGSSFYLVYAENEETGKEGMYIYDKEEGTIQRYNEDLVLYYQNKLNKEKLYLYITLSLIGILIVTLALVLIKKGKNKKRR